MMAGTVSVPDNFVKWDLSNDPLAPLSKDQKLKLSFLEDEIASLDPVNLNKLSTKVESVSKIFVFNSIKIIEAFFSSQNLFYLCKKR